MSVHRRTIDDVLDVYLPLGFFHWVGLFDAHY